MQRWPPILIATGALLGLAWTWLVKTELRQEQFLLSLAITGSAVILLTLWLVTFSGLSGRLRLSIAAGVLLLVGGLALLLRIEGVSGDLVPQFTFRWAPARDRVLPPLEPEGPPRTGTNGGAARVEPAISRWDSPQFLGARRDGTVAGVELETDWSAHPPVQVWNRPIGAGWSSFAVAGGYAVTQEQRDEDELVVCYELLTGDVVWTHADRTRYEDVIAGTGPRATPSIHEGRVYAVGATGILNCLDGRTGRRIWSVDVVAENDAKNETWGKSCSPLITGDHVLVTTDARSFDLVAYQKDTGELLWRGGRTKPSYASPSLVELAGLRQIVLLHHDTVGGYDPSDGSELWSHPWPGGHPKVTQPVPIGGDRLLLSSGYGVGCELIELRSAPDGRLAPRSVWKNRDLKSKFANIVIAGGFAYGLDDGILVCLDLETGKRRWKSGRYGHGQLLLAGDVLLVQSEDPGDIVLVEPSPDAHREIARFTALEGRTWNVPVLVPPYLLVRNAIEAACYRLELRKP